MHTRQSIAVALFAAAVISLAGCAPSATTPPSAVSKAAASTAAGPKASAAPAGVASVSPKSVPGGLAGSASVRDSDGTSWRVDYSAALADTEPLGSTVAAVLDPAALTLTNTGSAPIRTLGGDAWSIYAAYPMSGVVCQTAQRDKTTRNISALPVLGSECLILAGYGYLLLDTGGVLQPGATVGSSTTLRLGGSDQVRMTTEEAVPYRAALAKPVNLLLTLTTKSNGVADPRLAKLCNPGATSLVADDVVLASQHPIPCR